MASMYTNTQFKLFAGLLGGVSALVGQRVMRGAWNKVTGEEPPDPSDPEVPVSKAMGWLILSGVALGVIQVAIERFTSRKLSQYSGEIPDTVNRDIKFKVK